MDKETRSAIERATQRARKILQEDVAAQLEGTFDVLRSGAVAPKAGPHLTSRQASQREKIVAAIEHKRSSGMSASDAVADYLRDAAFTTLNRFVALKMLEARELVQECITKGEQSSGYREFCGMAPGVTLLPDSAGYRLFIESLFDELSTEVKVLFDRRDLASVLWPKRATFEALLEVLNATDLSGVWAEDETIGWVYQFFNSGDERKRMRDESQAPRNSRELAVRNQFFTPRYVVEFLVDNTLGRTWLEMYGEGSRLAERCRYFVRTEEARTRTRPRKDPRDLRVLDPACGSGHFLLYCFDLLLTVYEEAWMAEAWGAGSHATRRTLRDDYPDLASLRRATPALIVEHNLHGVDIDPRAAQIAPLALWLRAQRAWNDVRVPATERPPVRRTHVVVAEPMPGDAALVEEFAARLDPPLLRDLFRKMVSEMRLAGELGALIVVEEGIAAELRRAREQFVKQRLITGLLPGMEPVRKQGELDLSGIDDDSFFHEAEASIVEALRHFAETAAGGTSVRRRLFAGDAAQGIALIDLLRTRFNVVLMNPPFGLPTPNSKDALRRQYPDSWTDLFNAFLTRAQQLSDSTGACIGAIVPDRLLVSKKSSGVRKRLLGAMGLSTLVDIGPEVMDRAAVSAILLTSDSYRQTGPVATMALAEVVQSRAHNLAQWASNPEMSVDFSRVAAVPGSPFVLGTDSTAVDLWQRHVRLQPDFAVVATGAKTFDDFRFLRAWWEVADTSLGVTWLPVDTGGDYKPGLSLPKLVQRWRDEGREVRANASGERGTDAQVMQSSRFWFKKCIAYPYTSSIGFSPRLFFADSILSTDSVAITPNNPSDLLWLLGVLLSSYSDVALATFGSGRKTENGSVKSLPIERPADANALAGAVSRLIAIAREVEALEETSRAFSKPLTSFQQNMRHELEEVSRDIDRLSATAYDMEPRDNDVPVLVRRASSWLPEEPELRSQFLSHMLGMVFGRWEMPEQEGHLAPAELCEKLDMWPPALRRRHAAGSLWVAVDDKGHSSDMIGLIQAQQERLLRLGGPFLSATMWWNVVGGDELRKYVAREFFAAHLRQYSSGGRAAPIYWQLGTPSGRYSVWLYAHGLTRDSLFELQNEVVGSKLAHEERQLTSLMHNAGDTPLARERKAIAAQETLVEELRAMLDEVKRVAPLWNPSLDDGVVLTMAPLWRLVPQHKSWQKELTSKWSELTAGKYDWAHVAMHLWPERVVPKCATDRSLAIAHDLEDVFWEETGERKWRARPKPTRALDELVRERTSPAVKAALRSLLEAPMPGGGAKRGRRAKAIDDAGGVV